MAHLNPQRVATDSVLIQLELWLVFSLGKCRFAVGSTPVVGTSFFNGWGEGLYLPAQNHFVCSQITGRSGFFAVAI
jgi:hypothetical protein